MAEYPWPRVHQMMRVETVCEKTHSSKTPNAAPLCRSRCPWLRFVAPFGQHSELVIEGVALVVR